MGLVTSEKPKDIEIRIYIEKYFFALAMFPMAIILLIVAVSYWTICMSNGVRCENKFGIHTLNQMLLHGLGYTVVATLVCYKAIQIYNQKMVLLLTENQLKIQTKLFKRRKTEACFELNEILGFQVVPAGTDGLAGNQVIRVTTIRGEGDLAYGILVGEAENILNELKTFSDSRNLQWKFPKTVTPEMEIKESIQQLEIKVDNLTSKPLLVGTCGVGLALVGCFASMIFEIFREVPKAICFVSPRLSSFQIEKSCVEKPQALDYINGVFQSFPTFVGLIFGVLLFSVGMKNLLRPKTKS